MSNTFSWDSYWDNTVQNSRGSDSLMLGPDGSVVRKKVHDQEMQVQAAAAEKELMEQQTNPDMIAGDVQSMTAGEVAQSFGELVLGAIGGTAAVTPGIFGDAYGAIKGTVDAIGAENGKGFETFLESFIEQSDSWGSGYFVQHYHDFIKGLDIPEASKETAIAGSQWIGEMSEIPGALSALVKGLKAAGRTVRPGSNITNQVNAAAESLEPIIIDNPDAGPLDRSELPQPMPKPEQLPTDVDELGFYQKALEVAKNLEQKRGTAQQFIKRLRQNGVSSEEIDALGLRERFIDPNERITKDQFVQTINDRRIELQESVKTTEPSELAEGEIDDLRFGEGTVIENPDEWNYRTEEIIQDLQNGNDPEIVGELIPYIRESGRFSEEDLGRLQEQIAEGNFVDLPTSIQSEFEDAAESLAREQYMNNPYYQWRALDQDYEIVGNDDIGYGVLYEGRLIDDSYHSSIGEAEIVAREHAYNNGLISDAGSYGDAKFEEHMLPGGENYREILLRDPNTPTGGSPSHWSETDVIGHVLVKDRVDAQGNKTLYAEEVQSDFAQSARPSTAEKRRIEVNENTATTLNKRIELGQRQIDEYKPIIESMEKELKEASDPKVIEDLQDRLRSAKTNVESLATQVRAAKFELEGVEARIQEINDGVAERAEKVGKTRFVKDTQQWLRPTLKRLIAKAIEEGYDTVTVPPYQVVHERWNEDYGDFYRKSVPNTLLKVAKQLDPKARLEYSDLVDSAFPDLRGEAASRGLRPGTKGLDRTPTIRITPAMREAYKEKGQSLFVPGAATVIAGKLVVDEMTKDQKDDRTKAPR